jgi:orotidine-5'-phosphate decarboxylase
MEPLISPMTSPPICRNDSFGPPLHRDRQANFKLSFPSSGFDIYLMRNPIIAALDVPTAEAALKLVEQLAPVSGGFKIGSELFTSAGPDIVRRIRERGALVFLDLKFHDIPNTVAKSVAAAMQLDVQMLTVHTSGGLEMLKAAEQAAQETAWRLGHSPPLVLGVTVLTSLDAGALKEIGLDGNVDYQVRRLAAVATKAGLRGLVCSPLEVAKLRQSLPPSTQLVTPGVRTGAEKADDQKRTLTPREAMAAGANWLVIGRPIYAAENPRAAAEKILESLM